jgi:HEAT repeat protein
MFAAEELGQCKDPHAVEPLITALTDPDFNVRFMAAQALGKLEDPRGVDPLIAVLNENPFAAEALGEIKDPRAVGPLIAALRSPKKNQILYPFSNALGKIGSPAVDSLIAVLKDKDTKVRRAAIEALGKTKDPRGSERMAEYLLNCGDVQLEAAARAWAKAYDPGMHQQIYGVWWGSAREMQPSIQIQR